MPWYEVTTDILLAGVGSKTTKKVVEATDPCKAIDVAHDLLIQLKVTKVVEVPEPVAPPIVP